MREVSDDPDECFVDSVLAGSTASPDFADAVIAHRIVEAMYASAARDGASRDRRTWLSRVVVELTAEQTHSLRLAVLRGDTPTKWSPSKSDDMPGALSPRGVATATRSSRSRRGCPRLRR